MEGGRTNPRHQMASYGSVTSSKSWRSMGRGYVSKDDESGVTFGRSLIARQVRTSTTTPAASSDDNVTLQEVTANQLPRCPSLYMSMLCVDMP